MSEFETYQIDFKGLQEKETNLEYDLNDSFFAALDGAQLEHGALHVSVSIRKSAVTFVLMTCSNPSVRTTACW